MRGQACGLAFFTIQDVVWEYQHDRGRLWTSDIKRQAFNRLDNHNIAIATVSGSLAEL